MTSALYPLYKQAMLTQSPSVNLSSDTIRLALVDKTADYTYSAAHQFKSSVTSYSGSTDQTLANKSEALGLFDADDALFSALAQSSTKTVGALVIYKDTGVAGTSPLIAYIDGFTAITPNGGDIAVAFDNGTNKIFQI